MYKITILPLAKHDISNSARWYNEQQAGLGKRFARLVRKKVYKIASAPRQYAVRYSLVHTAIIDIFPFMIHYVIDDNDKTITIVAVLHTSLNPDMWTGRKQ